MFVKVLQSFDERHSIVAKYYCMWKTISSKAGLFTLIRTRYALGTKGVFKTQTKRIANPSLIGAT